MIKQCRSCSGNIRDVVSLGHQYLSEFTDGKKGKKYPLDLVMCTECSLLQLKESVDPKLLYTENYGYRSGISNTIKADLKDIVTNINKRIKLYPYDVVLDIGANDGELLSNYDKVRFPVGCEPIRKLAEECKRHAYKVINDFFSYEAWQKAMGDQKAKVITVISCFYDLEDPRKFVSDLTKVLDPDGLLVIQQNYLGGMMEQNAFDNIVHEHIEYYSLKSLEHLLNRYNLEVVDVELNDINGGSFRTYIKFMDPVKQLRKKEAREKLDNWGTYLLFLFRVRKIKNQTKFLIEELHKEGKTIYLLGASTRGNSLIQYLELDNTLVTKAVERNSEKHGKKIASLGIPIISEEQARKEKPDYMLVLPWQFKKEIVEREKKYLADGGHLIFALPELEIV